MISPASIQEVRDKSDILEVVSHFIQLKRRGSNYVANCPFHNEKTPSFHVSPTRGIYKCFGCGKAGDSVSFVQEYEKYSFVEAIKWLADFFHIELDETFSEDTDRVQVLKSESLRILNEYASKWFENNLWHTEDGKNIGLSYFEERGFTKQIITQFRLGYAPDHFDSFYPQALKDGFSTDILVASGLVSNKNDQLYDTYRGRVIFPIENATGKVLGFGARILKSNAKAPKYINTPENEIYIKSKILYGLAQSRTEISKKDECYLVEGYTDVISLHQNGIKNVVASSGTSLTDGQLSLIKRLTKNLTILYDGDDAGIKAAIRGMEMALLDSFNVNIVLLPQGDDPDGFIKKNGEKTFKKFVNDHKKDVIDFQLDLFAKQAAQDPVYKSQLVNDIAATIANVNKIEDFVIQQAFIKKAAKKLEIDEQHLITLVNKLIRNQLSKNKNNRFNETEPIQDQSAPEATIQPGLNETETQHHFEEEWKVIELLLKHGDNPYTDDCTLIQYFIESFDLDIFQDKLALNIFQKIYDWHNTGLTTTETVKKLIQSDDKIIQNKIISLLVDKEKPNPKWSTQFGIKLISEDQDYYKEDAQSAFAYFQLNKLQKMIQDNLQEIKTATENNDNLYTLMQVHLQLKEKERQLLNIAVKK